jgi:hypothetical protein
MCLAYGDALNLQNRRWFNRLAAALLSSLAAKRLCRGKPRIRINADSRHPTGGGRL